MAVSALDLSAIHAREAILPDDQQNIINTAGLNTTSNGWTMYKQCDNQWGSQQLGTCSETICSAGCAMSSVAMILATKGADHNPGSLDS